jgi:HlyD family secretion protein
MNKPALCFVFFGWGLVGGGACRRPEAAPALPPGGAEAGAALVARRADFERRLPLTGEIDAVQALEMKVPRVPNGKVTIRRLVPEGAEVEAGAAVVELDSTSFATQLRERTLAASQAEIDLQRQASQNGVAEADRALEVGKKRAIMKRAEIDADVPPGILPKRDYLEKQIALRRAKVDLEKAEEALAALQAANELDLKLKRIALEKTRREVKIAEEAMQALALRAPAAGTVLLGDHYEERRKFQEGDDVFMGMTVARIASSKERRIRAWLSDVDDGRVQPGMPVVATLDAHPDRQFRGKVREISPVAREPVQRSQRRVFLVGIDLEDAAAEILRPGLSARVEVVTERRAGALVVPRAAVERAPGGEREVERALEAGEVEKAGGARLLLANGEAAAVKLGPCSAATCIVESGIAEGTPLRRAP